MHRRRAALRALCGGGVLAARGTAGRKAGRCAGFDARYLGAYLRFGRAAWQCGCDMRGSHCAQAGYRAVCGGYAICGGLHSDRPSHRLKLHGNPLHVTALAWRSGRHGARYAQAESTLRRVIAPHVAVTRSAAHLYSVSPSHRLKLHGNPRHVPALAWRSGRRGARVILVALPSGGLSHRMWRLRDLRRAGTQSGRRTGRNHAADNGACQRCACAVCCSAACHCALNCAIDCCLLAR